MSDFARVNLAEPFELAMPINPYRRSFVAALGHDNPEDKALAQRLADMPAVRDKKIMGGTSKRGDWE